MEQEVKLIDINKVVKTPRKKREPKKKNVPDNVPETTIEEQVSEKDKLKIELLRLSDYDQDIITKPINNNLTKLVEEMSIDELKARVRQGKRITSGKLDDSVAKEIIGLANNATGILLGCYNELEESTKKDNLLLSTTKDYMAFNVLDHIPIEIKLAGLYGSHVTSAYYKASSKKSDTNPIAIPIEPVKNIEPVEADTKEDITPKKD